MRMPDETPDRSPRDAAPGELLPELAAGRLDALTAARVRRVIEGDAALAEEWGIIEAVRGASAQPVVDVARIVAALPAAPRAVPVVDLASRRPAAGGMGRWWLRAAAGIGVIAAGAAGVLASIDRGGVAGGAWPADTMVALGGPTTAGPDAGAAQRAAHAAVSASLASPDALEELSDEELGQVLSRLERFDGTTAVDAEDPMRGGGE
jgi:hypothetical protein